MNPLTPFTDGFYTGEVHITISNQSQALYFQVVGERITLENFHGNYANQLLTLFPDRVKPYANESKGLFPLFTNNAGTYGPQSKEEEEKIKKRLELDASRPYNGNAFTGFAIVQNSDRKIIGRISLGSGYEPGESQSRLIIEESFRGAQFGKEAICLAGVH